MKKVIGILSVFVIAVAIYFNAATNSDNDINLASLMTVNTANAEDNGMASCDCSWGWGANDGCKVSNWGFQCAPNGTTKCLSGDPNC